MAKKPKLQKLFDNDLVDTTDKLTFSLAVEMSSLDVNIQEYSINCIMKLNQ